MKSRRFTVTVDIQIPESVLEQGFHEVADGVPAKVRQIVSDDELRRMNLNGLLSATLKYVHDTSGDSTPYLEDGAAFEEMTGPPFAQKQVKLNVRVEEYKLQ